MSICPMTIEIETFNEYNYILHSVYAYCPTMYNVVQDSKQSKLIRFQRSIRQIQ